MEHFTELTQTRLEPLRNKQVFIEHFNLKGAFFVLIYFLVIKHKTTFSVQIRWLIAISAVYSGASIYISARSSVTYL